MPVTISEGYKYPPVTEAVIGINFAEDLSKAQLKSVSDKLAKNYPIHQPIQNFSVNLDLRPEAGKNHKSITQVAAEGHRRSTHDMTELALALPNSLVVSQLAPYPSWATFSKRFMRDWKLFKTTLGYREIKRIGVRYINRIDIPAAGELVHHEQFLNVFPQIPDMLNPLMAGAVQTISYFEGIKCRLNLNSGVVESPILKHTSFLLDLDVVREIDVPQKDADIFELLEVMRLKKNQVFEACISQRARDEIFNGDRNGK
jgi:uncharacterized protein (TIGR04255 family)